MSVCVSSCIDTLSPSSEFFIGFRLAANIFHNYKDSLTGDSGRNKAVVFRYVPFPLTWAGSEDATGNIITDTNQRLFFFSYNDNNNNDDDDNVQL